MYSGASPSPPDDGASTDGVFFVTRYDNERVPFECAWQVTEPEGTRVWVQVMEFSSGDLKLTIGNGPRPGVGVAMLRLDHLSELKMDFPVDMLSIGSGVWITLTATHFAVHLRSLRLILSTYDLEGESHSCLEDFHIGTTTTVIRQC